MLRRDEFREGDFGDYRERPTLHVGSPKQFIRLIGGAGVVGRYAISGDGQHFAEWDALEGGLPPGINCLVLDYTCGTPQCKIKLNRITIRTLPALAAQVADGAARPSAGANECENAHDRSMVYRGDCSATPWRRCQCLASYRGAVRWRRAATPNLGNACGA